MIGLIPKLSHLQPPSGMGAIRLDRFSPNYERASEMGFRNVRPVPAYRSVYRLPDEELARLAYFFAFDDDELRARAASIAELEDVLAAWRSRHHDSDLWATDNDGVLVIWDTRWGKTRRRTPAWSVCARAIPRLRSLPQRPRAGDEPRRLDRCSASPSTR